MAIEIAVYSNSDDVFLAWRPDADIPSCLGFAIERKINGKVSVLENRVGFSSSPQRESMPSTEFPFQRLTWTDHEVGRGDRVSYRVRARVGTPDSLSDGPISKWTNEIELTPIYGDVEAYFNRGIVLSQFIGKLMAKNKWKPSDLRPNAAEVGNRTREFLAGELRLALLSILDEAINDKSITLNAALFELTDAELLARLKLIGNRLNIVLANGAVKAKDDDENADARKLLKSAGANCIDRMSAPRFLAHNKFVVISRKGKPEAVWTGSANWQPTGLCTQANNGILIRNASLAQTYLEAWTRISLAGDNNRGDLVSGNTVSPPKVHTLKNKSYAFAQFTAAQNNIDIHELLDLIAGAKQSLLFAMFMPGKDIFNAATARSKDIYVRGVVNTFPKADSTSVDVSLINSGKQKHNFSLDVIEPKGIDHAFSNWVEEITTRQFQAIGHAIIHSKMLVIDAFGENPTIVTGSHNFSNAASTKNDENFLVISGNRALAQAYAVNVFGLYDHYRWRNYVAQASKNGVNVWNHLSDDKNWLKSYSRDKDRTALLKVLGL